MVNKLLKSYITYCFVYLEDFLIYSNYVAYQEVHVPVVLDIIHDNGFHLKPSMCIFGNRETKFVGLKLMEWPVNYNSARIRFVQLQNVQSIRVPRSYTHSCG